MDADIDPRMFMVVAAMLAAAFAIEIGAIAFHWTSADTIMSRGHTAAAPR